ncbi:MAG TPA: glycosyltransferase family 2 protein [Thermoleophilaceae bacterium]|nr:glycosyltransferase family 2 protein [Thermoleophilaceae bacterium]
MPSSSGPLLEVVVVTSTGARDLMPACLGSLRDNPPASGEMVVHVVDNASTDGTPELVRDRFPEVVLHALDWNSGFCVANNLVLRASHADFVLVLNPDTEVYEGVLDHMLGVMGEHPDVGMASCRLAKADGTLDHASKRSFPTPLGALAHFLRVGRSRLAPRRLAQYRAPELGEHDAGEVDAVNGAFMLVRREALEDVGLLDEGYWLYMDDLDWCFRFKRKGWKVWYDGAVTIKHLKGGTTVRNRHRGSRHNVAFHRSMGRFYRKFYAGERPLVDAAIYVAILAKLTVSLGRSAIARRSLS